MKIFRIQNSQGVVAEFPASLVAESRARHYAASDTGQTSGPEFDKAYAEEYEFSLSSDDELTDWAANSMDWADVQAHAQIVMIPSISTDFSDAWGEFSVLEAG